MAGVSVGAAVASESVAVELGVVGWSGVAVAATGCVAVAVADGTGAVIVAVALAVAPVTAKGNSTEPLFASTSM